jgi:hypothetical protein
MVDGASNMTEDEHRRRVVDRAITGIASAISRYRAEGMDFESMVSAIEVRINSMIGMADPEWIEEWRSNWNRLEYVNAVMIDDDRDNLEPDERDIVNDALDTLESMTHR